jgi:choline dehydrogenase-like flavoprotein
MIVVVGSGPSGVSCAQALLDRGLPVTMVDAGLVLEPSREEALVRIRARPSTEWKGELVATLLEGTDPDRRGLPGKRAYGSDFAYRNADPVHPIVQEGVDTLASHALGGLSNVWGANALPFLDSDIADWPIGNRELGPYYRAVFGYMPLSAAHDDLEALFPIHANRAPPLRPSPQAAAILTLLPFEIAIYCQQVIVEFGCVRRARLAHLGDNRVFVHGLNLHQLLWPRAVDSLVHQDVGRPAAERYGHRPCRLHGPDRRARHEELRTRVTSGQERRHPRRIALPASGERPLAVRQAGLLPARLGMADEDERLRGRRGASPRHGPLAVRRTTAAALGWPLAASACAPPAP